ncbi:hypothetical protein IscW_ISCW000996 [Ixodes scapularis]|uniref:Uncharacterized protein n=1 Tax=Ixodes scapularis TaxID=6945 RepID=B7P6N6_IXOSC|nr:hypothetical protein IscW_ISCW000996 [Ixodes scapularis]|eukprot:XP_002409044.1 hypothetical protein IscW_ISCW000996 [Ixodes scapularis]
MDSCLGARGLFGHSSSSDAAFGSRQLEVIQDLDLYFIRQIARGLGVDAFASDETVRRKLTGELARELRRERFQAVPTGPAGPNRHGVFVISGARR